MNTPHPTAGLWMLGALAALVLGTGLPVWCLLIGCASLFAAAGWVLGLMDPNVLSAISGRTLGLLENDLLQALPLYVFVGVLLQRLTVADALFSSFARLFHRTGAGTSMAAFGVGALLAPMNGSVASSSAMLARLVAPRLAHLDAAAATALVSASSTIGVVVPPSLVLILLGDAMLRAHTEASNFPGYTLGTQRIINTQDVFHAALLPALCVLILWLTVAWWQGRKLQSQPPVAPVSGIQWMVAGTVALATVLLLGGVYMGRIFAVEAAATGALALVSAALLSRALDRNGWRQVLSDTLSLSGALLALLVGASTFSLVFRLWGTDAWITQVAMHSPWSPSATAAVVLVLVAFCAWVLDAFEMIFVIVPIVAPVLITQLGDAQQSATLLLMVLQMSFLVPPMGYAVMMARLRCGLHPPGMRATLRALLPYLGAQCAVTLAVFSAPWTVHRLDTVAPPITGEPAMSVQDIEQQMRAMSEPVEPQDGKKP